jgi:hypothetical protein
VANEIDYVEALRCFLNDEHYVGEDGVRRLASREMARAYLYLAWAFTGISPAQMADLLGTGSVEVLISQIDAIPVTPERYTVGFPVLQQALMGLPIWHRRVAGEGSWTETWNVQADRRTALDLLADALQVAKLEKVLGALGMTAAELLAAVAVLPGNGEV